MCRGGNLSANKKHHLDVKNIIGVDNNKYLIALLKKVQETNMEHLFIHKNNLKYINREEIYDKINRN